MLCRALPRAAEDNTDLQHHLSKIRCVVREVLFLKMAV